MSETELFDFMGWLTTRKERLVLSASDDAAPAADAVGEYIRTFPERLARSQPHSRQEGEISERRCASNADSGSPPPQQKPVARRGPISEEARLNMVTAQRRRRASELGNVYWLIERGSPAEWWVSGMPEAWTSNAFEAQRFNEHGAREHIKDLIRWGVQGDLRVTQHVDLEEPPLESSPAQAVLNNYEPCLSVGRCRWNEQAVPEGFVLVPKEPSKDMLRAMEAAEPENYDPADTFAWERASYKLMLSAAPQPATKQEGE